MSRCIALVLGLIALMIFFAFQPFEDAKSQTMNSNAGANSPSVSPAVNALAVGAANYDSSNICMEKTIQQMDEAVAQDPGNSRRYTDRAFCRKFFAANLSLDDYERSISKINADSKADVERAIAIDAKNPQAYFLRAKAAAESLEFSEPDLAKPVIAQIVRDLDRVVELQPGFSDIYYYRAIFKFYELKDRDGGIKDLSKAINLFPRNVNFLTKRAELFAELSDWANEAKDYSAVLLLEPKNDYARLNRAKSYRQSGEFAKALLDLNQTLKQAPYFIREVLEERSKVYLAMGNRKAAAADTQRLRRIH